MRLLIADDELQIREGLAEAVDWAALGIDSVLTAENGVDAWEQFCRFRPEIVITDIRMPGMDGLELSRRVRAADPTAQLLVLSGYSEFSYAREALQLGVRDYLLKPVDLEELQEKAARCRAEILQQRSEQQLRTAYTRHHWQSQVRELLRQPQLLDDAGLELLCRELPLQRGQVVAVAILSVDDAAPSALPALRRRLARLTETLEAEGCVPLCAVEQGTVLLLPAFLQVRMEQSLRAWQSRVNQALSEEFGATVTVALSDVGTLRLTALLCDQARLALHHRLYSGGGSFLLWSRLKTVEGFGGHVPLPADQLAESFRCLQQDRAQRLAAAHFDELIRRRITAVEPLQAACVGLKQLMRAELRRRGVSREPELGELPHYVTADAYARWAQARLAAFFHLLEQEAGRSGSREAALAAEYILDHYAENLTLEEVAQAVGKSKNYFSSLFKREMGMSFVDYLTQVRIQAARKLLETTDLLTYQVAEAVGFRDYRYFSTVFKKLTGRSPASYRKGRE